MRMHFVVLSFSSVYQTIRVASRYPLCHELPWVMISQRESMREESTEVFS